MKTTCAKGTTTVDHGQSCWCVFRHGRHLNHLLEACTCGNSVLRDVLLPRSTRVTKVVPFPVHLLPSWTWVEKTSQERRCAMSTLPSYPFSSNRHASNPKPRRNKETRDGSFILDISPNVPSFFDLMRPRHLYPFLLFVNVFPSPATCYNAYHTVLVNRGRARLFHLCSWEPCCMYGRL